MEEWNFKSIKGGRIMNNKELIKKVNKLIGEGEIEYTKGILQETDKPPTSKEIFDEIKADDHQKTVDWWAYHGLLDLDKRIKRLDREVKKRAYAGTYAK